MLWCRQIKTQHANRLPPRQANMFQNGCAALHGMELTQATRFELAASIHERHPLWSIWPHTMLQYFATVAPTPTHLPLHDPPACMLGPPIPGSANSRSTQGRLLESLAPKQHVPEIQDRTPPWPRVFPSNGSIRTTAGQETIPISATTKTEGPSTAALVPAMRGTSPSCPAILGTCKGKPARLKPSHQAALCLSRSELSCIGLKVPYIGLA
ncbi:hypothetical protein EJ04DRAFT_31065 [Polyplosphaeria fusca]|uniref:Uncharacterized protein n=1 Tax=Polyplosphaeria fusca TaxID=682080 RepID=A0A9P4QSU3_9PLEO|nr:hypothetical protein EJ04DRAFT_31065 [Polyplosphaeria fusca]